jgi:anti-sigma regulatory factor (Ser/Thr protein kinase)
MCPYDTSALDPAVVDEARRNHPFVSEGGIPHESPDYRGLGALGGVFAEPLPVPPVTPVEVMFEAGLPLTGVRRTVTDYAARAGLAADRTDDLVLAVNELATNSLRHGGGHGTLRLWDDADALVCEVQDGGRIGDSLAGRERPGHSQTTGRGLWLVHQLCDLVQLRSLPTGTIVRLRMLYGGAGGRDFG